MTDDGWDEVWARRRTSFGSAAADYANGRPTYPREALEWGVAPYARTVLDLGAGTGIVTAGLLGLGLDVVSVEPLPEMRALIPAPARAVDGSAEQIPLPDGAVDTVFAGQAWHWFDPDRALPEIRRVLALGGRVVLMWNMLDTADDLTRDIADIIDAEERTDSMVEGEEIPPPFDDDGHFGPLERAMFFHRQRYDPERIVRYAVSRSQAILLADTDRAAMIARLRAAVPDREFDLALACEAWRGTAV
jgi:SAM-dependent methyltransferase